MKKKIISKSKIAALMAVLAVFLLMTMAVAGCGDDENSLSELGTSLGSVDLTKEDAAVIAEIMDSEPASSEGNISAVHESIEQNKKPKTIFVHVCGAVNVPGVYELYEGSRVCEALLAAGDFRNDADSEYLNQAAIVSDGDKIYVPTLEETLSGMSEGVAYSDDRIAGSGDKETSDGLININTASVSELKSLPGIGDVKAEAIVSYRETNGKFKSIDDITKVPGVKSGLLEQIRSKICAK